MSGAHTVMVAKKKGNSAKQLTMDFFSRPGTTNKFISTTQPTIECDYCDRRFTSPQGLSSHLKQHYLALDRKKKKPKFGKVKLRDIGSSANSTDTDNSTQNNTVSDEHVQSNNTGNDGMDVDVSNEFDAGNDSMDEVDAENETGDVDGHVTESEEGDSENNKPVAAKGGASNTSRSPQLRNIELIEILDEWKARCAAAVGTSNQPSKERMIRWVRTEYKRPKFQRKQFIWSGILMVSV